MVRRIEFRIEYCTGYITIIKHIRSEWGACSKTCGGGTRSKRRQCVYPDTRAGDGGDNECLEQLEVAEVGRQNMIRCIGYW